jgi:hypothetical protein
MEIVFFAVHEKKKDYKVTGERIDRMNKSCYCALKYREIDAGCCCCYLVSIVHVRDAVE